MRGKYLVSVALASAALFASAPASAAIVQFTGSTQGCFGSSCTPTSTATLNGGVLLGGLTFNGGSFNQSTDETGFLGVGGTVPDNLGLISVGAGDHVYTGQLFTLLVNFTQPGSTSGSFQAALTGHVISLNSGSVFFDFDNTPQFITYDGGLFSLQVNDVSVTAGGLAQAISGQIQALPEPGTWGMMLLGFAGIGMAMRRSRRRQPLMQVA